MSAFKPLEQFTLTPCHPLCLAASTNNKSLLGLLQPTDAQSFECDEHTGINLSHPNASLISTKTLDGLREHLSINEWSLSTWITAEVPSGEEAPKFRPILMFGSGNVSRTTQSDGGCGGYYMMIAQFGSQLVYSFEDATQACRMIRMSMFDLQHDVPVSLTIATSGSMTNLYLQGQAVMESITLAVDLTRLPMNQTLQLFPEVDVTDSTSGPFRGSIMQVSFFDETLASEQVQRLFEEGVGEAAVVPLYLEARASETVVIEQDVPIIEPALIWVGGVNMSTAVLPLFVDLQSLPAKGTLFTAGAEIPLGLNSIPIPVNSTGMWIEYRRPSSDYFTVPSTNAYGETLEMPNESFEYRVVALWEQRTIAASKPVTQAVQIRNVNHAPTWINANEATTSIVNNAPSYNFSFPSLRDEADLNLNRVRVDLTVLQGRISLRDGAIHLADFDFCSTRSYSAWQCSNDGINKKRISFVAVPGDIADILAGLSYEGFVPGNEDTLVMDVFDGVGGQCLDEREHEAWKNNWKTDGASQLSTVFRGCYHVQSNMTIPSIDVSSENESDGSSWLSYMNLDFKNFGSADIVFWIVVLAMGYCLVHCVRDCCPKCLARGARVDAQKHAIEVQTWSAQVESQPNPEIKTEEEKSQSQQPDASDLV